MYPGYFIAGVETPKGQLTYHLPLTWWDQYITKRRVCISMYIHVAIYMDIHK